jgi:hypothetical protein
MQCSGNYHWCSVERDFNNKETKWKSGHPKALQSCVYLESSSQQLVSSDCNEEKRFLCEIKKEGTFAKAAQHECAEIWQISECE